MPRHLLTIFDLAADDIHRLFERTAWIKAQQKAGRPYQPLQGKTLAMIFEKPSTRTRVSFEVAMYQLGGHAVNLSVQATQLGRGESYEDTARVLSRYVDGITIRTFEQSRVEALAKAATVPVINGLTDLSHPCQILTDLFTILEERGNLNDCHVAYVGDGNNVSNSWIEAAIVLQFRLTIATPVGFETDTFLMQRVKAEGHTQITFGNDPITAVRGCDVINTDTWVSMGQEGDDLARKKAYFTPFQVNRTLLAQAKKSAMVLHCLPAHRGEEITDDVMDGPQSRIFAQAENRLHVQKALLEMLMK